MSKEIQEAKERLEEWLAHPNELGCKPKKTEYCNYFIDEDGIECYIFRFKETLFGKWMLGISSESGVYSEMKEYHKSSELEDAFAILQRLKAYWKQQAKQMQIQEGFNKNLAYISQTEINVEDIDAQFVKSETRFFLTIGEIDCISGKIAVGDPLAFFPSPRFTGVLEKSIPVGTYPVEVAIFRNEYIGIRMCTARLKIKKNKALRYEHAKYDANYGGFKDKDNTIIHGFGVDAGMMSFCDYKVVEEYQMFIDEFYKKNPNGNHYDDYFAKYFKESDEKYPAYQREGGDFICWENPISKHKLVMVASGLGDGFYQCFWGYDERDEICELIVPMVNPALFE